MFCSMGLHFASVADPSMKANPKTPDSIMLYVRIFGCYNGAVVSQTIWCGGIQFCHSFFNWWDCRISVSH